MSDVNPTLSDRVGYTLSCKGMTSIKIIEPIGWKDDEKETARHDRFKGIYTNFSNSLKFIGDGKDWINLVFEIYGINAEIRLVKDERHPKTDKWIRSYDGFLDLMTKEEENGKLSIKFNASSLEKLIKSRESEQLELERLDTIDGLAIEPLLLKKVALNGRKIFLKSLLEVLEVDKISDGFRGQGSDGQNEGQLAIPVSINYKSDELIHDQQRNVFQFTTGSANTITTGQAAGMFYANNNIEKDLKVNIKVTCKIKPRSISASNIIMRVDLVRYGGGVNFNLLERTPLYVVPNPYNMNNHIINLDYSATIKLLAGESLGLYWYGSGNFSGALFNPNDYLYVDFEETVASINIEEDSYFKKSQANVLLPYEVCNRLLQIITGRTDALYSEALGRTDIGYEVDGEASLIGLTHGHWVRGFIEGDELYKAFTTSLKDFLNSYLTVRGLGMGIEKIGFRERVRIEKKEFFYNRNVTVKLGKEINGKFEYIQPKNIKRSIATNYYYSSLEIGYKKGGEYEEAMGLDEYNTKSTFTTTINIGDKLELISDYRADSYGMEFARRKPKENNPTTDSDYDRDVFLMDLKRGPAEVFEQRLWFDINDRSKDDFEKAPTGTYNPDSATNLRLTPFNILLRHGWVIGSGLTKYPTDYVRYGSSIANSNLTTKLIGKPEYAENGNIQNNLLERARFVPEIIKFEFPVNFELMQKIQGSSVILGKTIPNVYGLVAFKNEKGEIEKGYLENLKPNNKGVWELLKANK
ncbi:MAG: hypothetical protein ACYCZ2_09375 [Lutibacter sp.]